MMKASAIADLIPGQSVAVSDLMHTEKFIARFVEPLPERVGHD
jgi:hypothetical protein